MIERIAQIIERQIDDYPTVLADPMTIRKIRANKLAQAVLTELSAGDGVQECDREAAKSLLGRDDAGPSWWAIDSGNADNDPMVQAFARHRTLAATAQTARIVAGMRKRAKRLGEAGYKTEGAAVAYAADAIEAGQVS